MIFKRVVAGIYDGNKVQLLEPIPGLKPGQVIVTFLEEENDTEVLSQCAADEDAFDFWKEEDDLYQLERSAK